jgi:hypothetical protein
VTAIVPAGNVGVPVNIGEAEKTTFPVPVDALSCACPKPFPTNTFPFAKLAPRKLVHEIPFETINSEPVDEEQSVQYINNPLVGGMAYNCILVIRGGKNPLVVLSISKIALGFKVNGFSPIFWAPCADSFVILKPNNKKPTVILMSNLEFIFHFFLF